MAPNKSFSAFILLILAVSCVASGCHNKQKTVAELVAESADLPGLRSSNNAELRAELKRIEAEEGTPRQLMANLPPDHRNVAAALATVFHENLLPDMLAASDALFPKDRFGFSTVDLQRVRAFRDGHLNQIKAIRSALTRPECNFGIEYDLGYNFEPVFIDEVVAACRLLAFDIAVELEENGPAAALQPLEQLFLLIRYLAKEKLVDARSKAIDLRIEGFQVLEAVAQDRRTSHDALRALYQLIRNQLDNWPPDRNALMGDRALVMHAYEGIRFKLLDWILTPKEKEALKEERVLDTLGDTLHQTADMDELYYLRTMRRMIDISDRPFFQRTDFFDELMRDLQDRRSQRDFPFAAARLFLPGLDIWMERSARDRARCEGWALALALAADMPKPGYRTNPHTGREYRIVREPQRVIVVLGEPNERDPIVPLPSLATDGRSTANSQLEREQKPAMDPKKTPPDTRWHRGGAGTEKRP